MALEAQNNPFTSVLMVEAADPEAIGDADPAAGQRRLVVGTDHLLYLLDDSGVKHAVGGGIANPLSTDSLWDAAGDLVQGTGANTAAKLSAGAAGKVLTSNGAAAALTWETPSSGGTAATPTPVQMVNYPASSATSGASITIAAAASGHRLVLGIGLLNRAVTGVSSTNTTWTLVKAKVQSGIHIEVWVGVVAGGSSGTTITVTSGSTDWLNAQVIEIADTLTPTLGNNSDTSNSAANADNAHTTNSIVTSAGQVVVGMYGSANGAGNDAAFTGANSALFVSAPLWPGQMMLTYGQGRPIIFRASKGTNIGSAWAALVCVIT
jgi:hypothetical protein